MQGYKDVVARTKYMESQELEVVQEEKHLGVFTNDLKASNQCSRL